MDAIARQLLRGLDFDPEALRAVYARERDKRLRRDANDQYIQVTAEFSSYPDDPFGAYKVRDGGGPDLFFERLDEWRIDGRLERLELRS